MPVTQVAKESILAATDKASELVTTAHGTAIHDAKRETVSPSVYLSRSLRGSQKSSPVAASAETSDAVSAPCKIPKEESHSPATVSAASVDDEDSTTKRRDLNRKPSKCSTPRTDFPEGKTSIQVEDDGRQAPEQTLHWRAWFARTGESTKPEARKSPSTMILPADSEPKDAIRHRNSNPNTSISKANEHNFPRSWFGLWAAARTLKSGSADGVTCAAAPSLHSPPASCESATPGTGNESEIQQSQPTSVDKSSGWAFWSRSPPGNTVNDAKQSKDAELVIPDGPSQAGFASPVLDVNRGASDKRPCSANSGRKAHTSQSAQTRTLSETLSIPVKKQTITAESEALHSNKVTPSKNLLLPRIQSTYRSAPKLSLLESFSRWWQDDLADRTTSVHLVHNPLRIERAIAIVSIAFSLCDHQLARRHSPMKAPLITGQGIHGYFPAPLIRSVLGQPTGTSVRFADGAASAIQSWTSAHGQQCEIEKVALEGEGRILERVDLLWKLLLNWIDNIRRADFVMVACHSQGVPVAIMLIAKLIEFGCVNNSRIGVCAMAGVNLGPFVDFKSRWIGGSAGELFEFARPDSQVSRDYRAALATVLKFGTRIAYIGSIDDQLVSLELRNLGVSDHGLIRELSAPLAGSLYGGEGHSKIYEDEAVY
ncbi:MAG: hypothetical protein Q9193_005665 [Seirophora villosa]